MSHERANAHTDIHDIIARRWSPRAFDAGNRVDRDKLAACLEAARWAPSCFGEEPWRFLVCDRHADEGAWQGLHDCLSEKNQSWAGSVPVLILVCAGSAFRANGSPNRWAQYDTGAAAVSLGLQAPALGLASHKRGGFDAERARERFAIPDAYTPMTVVALGYPTHAGGLDAGFHALELGERRRRELGEHFYAGAWDAPFA